MTSTPQITLGAWNVEAENPEMLGQFWAGVLGTEVDAYGGMAICRRLVLVGSL